MSFDALVLIRISSVNLYNVMLGASSVSCDSSTKICDIFSSHDDRLLAISDDDEMSSQPLSYIL